MLVTRDDTALLARLPALAQANVLRDDTPPRRLRRDRPPRTALLVTRDGTVQLARLPALARVPVLRDDTPPRRMCRDPPQRPALLVTWEDTRLRLEVSDLQSAFLAMHDGSALRAQ